MIRKIILYFFILGLSIPFLELNLDFVKERKLKGHFYKKKDISLNISDWFSGTYQTKKEAFLNDTIGFSNTLTRIRNQLDYDLYNVTHNKGIIIGYNDMLYQKMYIDAYTGIDYAGHEKLSNQVQKYVLLQKLLNERGIYLRLVIAPGKASLYPENIPDYLKSEKDTTNYEKVTTLLGNNKYLDFKAYFLSKNKDTKYPLFPNHGTHWSGYGVTLAADTLYNYLESTTGFDLPNYVNVGGEVSKEYRYSDNDIGKTLNLVLKNTDQLVYYPEVTFDTNDSLKQKPNVLIIGDSFTMGFWNFYPYFNNWFDNKSRFWYYNKNIAWPFFAGNYVKKLDLHDEINSRDIILVVTTEQNLNDIGFGFIEKAYAILTNNDVLNKEKMTYYSNYIKSNPKLLKIAKDKALTNSIPIDSMLYLEAKWLYNIYLIDYFRKKIKETPDLLQNAKYNANQNNISLDSMITIKSDQLAQEVQESINTKWFIQDVEIAQMMEKIKRTPDWLSRVKTKAREKGITTDEQLRRSAKYVIDQRNYKDLY